jgi:uncharacterized protein (UPF0332 family)
LKEFSFFLATNAVRKQQPNVHLAQATARESLDRIEMAKGILRSQKPKYALENAYEAVRELIDAILFLKGYKSYSHEASVSYMMDLGFSEGEMGQIDRLRRRRNGIKYYGEDASLEEAEEAVKIAGTVIKKLLRERPELRG